MSAFVFSLIFAWGNPTQNPAQSPAPSSTSSAEDLYRQRLYAKVIALLSPKVEKLSRREIILLGNSYSGLGNHSAALKTFTAVLGQNSKDHELKTLAGREYLRLGKDTDAMNLLRSALEDSDKYEPAFRLIAEIYTKKRNFYELRILYQDLVEKLGEKPEYVNKICELATKEGLNELAEKNCQRGIQLNSKEPSNYVFLGISLKQRGDPEKAAQYLKQAADSFPKSVVAQLNYAQHLEEQKVFVGAYQYYQRATEADSKNHAAWTGLGLTGVEIQKYTESFAAFKTACKIEPNSVALLRRATSSLRTYGVNQWLSKFENLIDSCK